MGALRRPFYTIGMKMFIAAAIFTALACPAAAVSPQSSETGAMVKVSSGESEGATVGSINADPRTRTAKAAGALGGGLLAIAAVAMAISRSRKEGPTT